MISEERLRNTRNWAAARVGELSGAEVIVGAIDELLQLRATLQPAAGTVTALGAEARAKMAQALRSAAEGLDAGAEHVSGGLLIDVEPGDILVLLADLRLKWRPRTHPVDALKQFGMPMTADGEARMRAICDAPVTLHEVALSAAQVALLQGAQRADSQRVDNNTWPPEFFPAVARSILTELGIATFERSGFILKVAEDGAARLQYAVAAEPHVISNVTEVYVFASSGYVNTAKVGEANTTQTRKTADVTLAVGQRMVIERGDGVMRLEVLPVGERS